MKLDKRVVAVVGVFALVTASACGDDSDDGPTSASSNGAGSGGGQGDGGGAATTSSKASSSASATTTSSSSDGGGGPASTGVGAGGGGEGGEESRAPLEGCTPITIERAYQHIEGQWSFLVSPEMGDPARDVLDVLVWGRRDGEIDLGSGENRSSGDCVGCVTFKEDLDLDSDYGEERTYFQWSGTMNVVRDGGDNGGAELSFDGVTLIESEPEPDGFVLIPIEGGACVEIVDATVQAGAPEAWSYFPDSYGDGSSCDCGHGAPDPDCDDPDDHIVGCGAAFGEGDEAPTCSAEATCILPAAWTCTAQQWNDDETCDCNCGAPDPDCYPFDDLPVTGCTGDEACRFGDCFDIPDSWTCPADTYAAQDRCDCECGAYDPDCDTYDGFDCGSDSGCSAEGACGVTAGWTCAEAAFADGATCDCDCGVLDPDCTDPALTVVGCDDGEACTADGACAPRVPNDQCADAIPVVEGWTTVSWVGAVDDMDPGNLGCTPYPAPGGDVFFSLSLEAGQKLNVQTRNPDGAHHFFVDPSLYLITDCGDVESCVTGSDTGDNGYEDLYFDADEAVDLILVVDQGNSGMDLHDIDLWIDIE